MLDKTLRNLDKILEPEQVRIDEMLAFLKKTRLEGLAAPALDLSPNTGIESTAIRNLC